MSIDWEQELTQLRREVEELAASGIGKEAGIRASAAMFARMLVRTGALAPMDGSGVEGILTGQEGDIVGYEIGPPPSSMARAICIRWHGSERTMTAFRPRNL